jgi:urease accessory protein
MLRAHGVIGNVETDEELAAAREAHAAEGTLERLVLEEAQRRRSRFRAETDAGTEVGVVAPGVGGLRPGDVLVEDERMVVVALESREVVTVELPPADEESGTALATAMLEAGHVVGNRHWELAIDDGIAYVPVAEDYERTRSVLADALPEGTALGRDTVDPGLFDGTTPSHGHGHGRHHDGDDAGTGGGDGDSHEGWPG